MHRKQRLIYALIFVVLLLVEGFIALFIKDKFVRPYIGDVLVAVLICCFCRVLIPNKVTALPAYAFAFTTVVELMQYFDLVKLLGMENNKFISTLLGRTFSLADILCYAVGCLVFWGIDVTMGKGRKL